MPEATASEIIQAAKAAAFKDVTPAAAFAHFRSKAEAVPTTDLVVFTSKPLLLLTNVQTALDVLEPHLEVVVNALRDPQLQGIFELPSLVMGLEYATERVPVATMSTGEIDHLLSQGAIWRQLMLDYLEVVSEPQVGLVPRERVVAIRSGRGKLDKAQDFVAISGMFTEFASSLAGKHPFTQEKIDWLSGLGATLVQQVKPGQAVTVSKRSSESILRDQFAHLVVDGYDRLLVLAGLALGKRKADELLPALRTAVVRPGASDEPTEPKAP